jgi:hypothetical protein
MTTKSWKVVIVGPTGAVVNTSAFKLLYPFPTREEAEAHAECFRTAGMKVGLCDELGNPQDGDFGSRRIGFKHGGSVALDAVAPKFRRRYNIAIGLSGKFEIKGSPWTENMPSSKCSPKETSAFPRVSTQNIQSFLLSEIVTAVTNPRPRRASFRL